MAMRDSSLPNILKLSLLAFKIPQKKHQRLRYARLHVFYIYFYFYMLNVYIYILFKIQAIKIIGLKKIEFKQFNLENLTICNSRFVVCSTLEP